MAFNLIILNKKPRLSLNESDGSINIDFNMLVRNPAVMKREDGLVIKLGSANAQQLEKLSIVKGPNPPEIRIIEQAVNSGADVKGGGGGGVDPVPDPWVPLNWFGAVGGFYQQMARPQQGSASFIDGRFYWIPAGADKYSDGYTFYLGLVAGDIWDQEFDIAKIRINYSVGTVVRLQVYDFSAGTQFFTPIASGQELVLDSHRHRAHTIFIDGADGPLTIDSIDMVLR